MLFPPLPSGSINFMSTGNHLHLHLVSDATGDTVRSVARACLVQFEDVQTTEHFWVLVRSAAQMERVIEGIAKNPGLVLCTVVDEALRAALEHACRQMKVRYVPLLDPVISAIAVAVGGRSRGLPGRQHSLDEAYFDRIEAMHYTMAHDDGQGLPTLPEADLVLVGVSRTSKTPTCIYLANRGLKAANVPFVPEVPLPRALTQLSGPLIVGLTVHPARLIQIRRNRLLMLREDNETAYVDIERVEREVREARRYFLSKNWPVIDVTRRSIEETAAAIIQVYERHTGGEDA
jgi:regulator of PEP synthase PpsR (kinase-PPPase family)